MSPVIRSSNSSPGLPYIGGVDSSLNLLDDLNINIETIPGDFECNVDEVIRHELSIGGSLDFNFSTGSGVTAQNPQSNQTASSSPAAAAAAAAAATAAATTAATSNHGQPSFSDHSWVH